MTTLKLAILSLFLVLICTAVRADVSIQREDVPAASDGDDSSTIGIELERLKSKIHSLESHVDEKTRELKGKEDTIVQKEKIIQEKSDNIASLEKELSSLQKKGTIDAAEQIDDLRKESERQQRDREAFEARATEAENKISELKAKLENLQKINEEQRSKIWKTERAFKVAEVQVSVQEMLKKNELTRPLATRELEWFVASALLALPIFIVFRMCSDIFWLASSWLFSILWIRHCKCIDRTVLNSYGYEMGRIIDTRMILPSPYYI